MKNILIIIFLLFTFQTIAQKKHKITVKINNANDTVMVLANYWGNKIKIAEKTHAEEPGVFVFAGDSLLPGGIYMLVNKDKSKLFEFIIDKNQIFSLTTTPENYIANMKVKGDKENKLFFKYLLFNESIFIALKSIDDSLIDVSPETKKFKILSGEKDSLKKILKNYKKNVIDNNKGTFTATLLKAMQDITIPDSIKNNSNKTETYKYLKKHYWDNFDLSDSRLLRTPLYDKKIKEYFNNIIPLDVDSVIKEVDKVIALAKPNKETVGFLVWHFTSEYQNPKYMGFDKVFVHLVDNYFTKMDIAYTTPSILESLKKRADALRPLLIGKQAPNLILTDTTGNYRSFLNISAEFTVLLFWDYKCGICKAQIKELKKILSENKKYNIEVFAVNTNNDIDKWKKMIKEREIEDWINVNGTNGVTQDFFKLYDIDSTPVIYILDKNKKIIAKKIDAENIIKFLKYYTAKINAND